MVVGFPSTLAEQKWAPAPKHFNEWLNSSIALHDSEAQRTRRLIALTKAFVVLGLLVRAWRFLLCFPLWGDEAALAANLLDRGFAELLRPLDFQQVAPFVFLWIELAVVKAFGFGEWSIRAFPFVCSLGSVILFRHVAGRLMRGVPLLLAVAIFAVAYYPVRLAAEAKQYSLDLLVALVLLAFAIECCRPPTHARWLWWLAVASPLALALSYPAVFVVGGLSGVLLCVLFTSRNQLTRKTQALDRSAWVAYLLFNLSALGAFAALYLIHMRPQFQATIDEGVMGVYWARAFPPLGDFVDFARWLVSVHAGQMFAYPIGGAGEGSGLFGFLCVAVGCVYLFRQRKFFPLVLLLSPFALTFVAAVMKRYPYGGFARTSQYLAPSICLLAGLGLARLIERTRRENAQRWAVAICVVLLAAWGMGTMVRDCLRPYRTEHDQRVREFAQRLWTEKAANAELVCALTDLNQEFFRKTYLWRGIAQYLCNQRIYSPRHLQAGRPPHWDGISADRPLRCVVFSRPGLSRNEQTYSAWLADMKSRFELVGCEKTDFEKPHDHGADIERIEVFEFVPRPKPLAKREAGSTTEATQMQ